MVLTLFTPLTYLFLYLSVVFLWVPNITRLPTWSLLLSISVCFGLISHHLSPIALVFIALLWITADGLKNSKNALPLRILSALGLLVVGTGLETFIVPGFYNLKVLNNVTISHDGIPFNLYLNFDKTLVGIVILGTLHPLITTRTAWKTMFKTMLPMTGLVILGIGLLSFLCGFVHFDFKLPESLGVWAVTNLLFVCTAEEGLFRGFIQKYLCITWKSFKYGHYCAIFVSAILFGLAHYTGGLLYMGLATVAGIGYGTIYYRTQRIEAAIITHFLLNLTHFLCFTYPALAIRS